MDEKLGRSRANLRAIAWYQKGILICVLVYIILVVVQITLQRQIWPLLLAPALILSVVAPVFVFLLASKVYGTGLAILLVLLTLIPLVGLLVLLIINRKATELLKDHGIRVGLLGARMSDFS